MKSYHKHKHRLRHRLFRKCREHFKFFLYLAALVLLVIGNNFASFRSDDQPGPKNYMGENYSPENNKGLGGVQQGLTSIHTNTPLIPTFGVGEERQVESMIEYAIQSPMNLQHGGLREWEDYLLTSLGSSTENHQNIGEGRLGSFFSHLNNEGGGKNPPGMIGPPLEYPHSTNYGGGYNTASAGGSLGSTSSGGGSVVATQDNNGGAIATPEPSTLILTAIGLLLVTRRVNQNRIQGVKARQRRERIPLTQSDERSE